ncbi:MAG TPA: ATP-grasp domain-containing protein, partial [Devosia sp.]|nr:ATP-grasp domain-containing protein [Devosia sp.]
MIGILGGGQLGRMLALAASRLGMRTHIYCPDPDSPAFEVTPHKTIAAYDDEAALAAFADSVDVITYEFENVPAATAEFLSARRPLRPGANALAISQDRLAEKAFLSSKNIPVAPYRAVESLADLDAAIDALGLPAVLKTTRLGYDGKGQRVLRERAEAAAA